MTHKRPTLAQAQRSKLAKAIKLRGDQAYNIWLVRPPFESRDLLLGSDLQFEAFYALEGEPTIIDIRYLPSWYDAGDEQRVTKAKPDFAVVTTRKQEQLTVRLEFGEEETPRHTSSSLEPVDGLIRINLAVLDGNAQRVENWRRVIPCIRRVRLHATRAIELQIAAMVHKVGKQTLRELRGRFTEVNEGLFWGALATLLRRRELASDLDSRPWGFLTLVWDPET